MKKIFVLSTGGTIASRVDQQSGLLMAGEQTGEELLSHVNLNSLDDIEIKTVSVFQVPSNQITYSHITKLFELMENFLNNENASGFVITHGTDTLEETSYTLSLLWRHHIPVVITGAQVAPTENNTDAFHNIECAILAAANPESCKFGVIVVFNDQIFDPKYVMKNHSSNIQGFEAPDTGPLGVVDNKQVRYFVSRSERETYPMPSALGNVSIVKEYMGIDSKIYDLWFENGVSGIIVEGFGRGHVTVPSAIEIENIIKKGVIVIICTSCIRGAVASVYGFKGSLSHLIEIGALSGRDYASKKARIRLALLLGNGYSMEQIKNSFDQG